MKTLILHIGNNKTGTSALQYFFLQNRHLLEKQGVYYPRSGCNKMGMHHPLFVPLDVSNITKSSRSFASMVNDLKIEIIEKELVLLSSELVVKLIRRDLFSADELFKLFERVIIMLYLRRQDDFFESSYRQLIQSHLTDSFTIFYEKQKFRGDYYKTCKKCVSIVGRENLIVRPYEVGHFEGGSIFHDFFASFGWDLTEEYSVPADDVNISLGLDEIQFKILFNHLALPVLKKRKIGSFLENYTKNNGVAGGRKKRLLSPSQRLEIIEHFEEINRKVATDFLDLPDGQLFKNPLPDLNDDWQPYDGLSNDSIKKIVQYLFKNHPESKKLLIMPVIKGLLSYNSETRRSACRLFSSFKNNSVLK